MATPFESAQLNLQLFKLRREPVLRAARSWFLLEFNPESLADVHTLAGGEHNAKFRMVLSYWEMAASLVTTGAIDRAAFLAAHNELIATFSKIHPFLSEMRAAIAEPEFCQHLETVLVGAPGVAEAMSRRREKIRAAAQARVQAKLANQQPRAAESAAGAEPPA